MNIEQIIKEALAEDIGKGDVTSNAIIPKDAVIEAKIIAKEKGIVCGVNIAGLVFDMAQARLIAPVQKIQFITNIRDGARVNPGSVIAVLRGAARKILAGERVALNFLQRMSGIATTTNDFVKKCSGTKAIILDTRKTTPLLRQIEKYAVKCGGGTNHRMGLNDAILIKDNHIAVLNDIAAAVVKAKKTGKVEVEIRNLAELKKALTAGADRILLDNMNISALKKAVAHVRSFNKTNKKNVYTEASGGVNIKNVRQTAKTGVDFISVGALTHSPKALDISLEIK